MNLRGRREPDSKVESDTSKSDDSSASSSSIDTKYRRSLNKSPENGSLSLKDDSKMSPHQIITNLSKNQHQFITDVSKISFQLSNDAGRS